MFEDRGRDEEMGRDEERGRDEGRETKYVNFTGLIKNVHHGYSGLPSKHDGSPRIEVRCNDEG